MLAWSEGTDNGRQKARNHGYDDVIVGGELFTDSSDHPRKLVTLNPKLKSTGAGRYQLLSRWWDAASSLAWKTSLRKSQDAVALRWSGAWRFMIGRGDIRQAIGKFAAISGLHCRALVMVSSSIRLTAWLQNSKKRAERSERLMYEQRPESHDYLRSGYLHHRLPVMGCEIITVITPLPTKPSATKMPENWSWRTRQLLTCRCVSVMLLRSMQNTRRS